MEKMTVSQAKKAISDKLSHFFGVDTKTATDAQYYKAVALIVRDRLSQMNSDFRHEAKGQDKKFIIFVWNSLWAAHLKIIFTILV